MNYIKKFLWSFICLYTLLSSTGCVGISNWGLKQDRQEIAGEISRKEGELNRHTRAFVSGAVDALSLSDNKSKEPRST